MNESRIVLRARNVAEHWHANQLDKTGAPYVGHLGRVSLRAAMIAPSTLRNAAAAAGWLHDILEDTMVPWGEVMAVVPHLVGGAVMALSHLPGEPWVDYCHRIASDGLVAPFVKWADMADNADPDRLALVREYQPDTWARMVENLPRRHETFRLVMVARGVAGPWAGPHDVPQPGSGAT